MTNETQRESQNGFLSLRDVLRITGLSKSTVYRQIKKGHFPKPRLLADRKVGFRQLELKIWLEERTISEQ